MMNKKIVDVIIPTYKPDNKFNKLIQSLQCQTYPIHQIHVIHTKLPGEKEVCGESELIKVTNIRPEEFDHGATRARGAEESDAEILVFMTQDAVPENGRVIEELVKAFDDEEVAAAYGRQLPDRDCGVIESYTREFNYPAKSQVKSKADLEQLGIKTFFCSNVCAAYRKSSYDLLGGFVKKAIFNEDMIMAGKMIQAGYKIAYAANAEVIHSHNYGCVQQFKRNFDLAVSQKEHPEIFGGIKSEDEGVRLVIQTMKYLVKVKKPWLIFSLVVKSGFKYLGYKFGSNYSKLPKKVVLKCTMNQRYWLF